MASRSRSAAAASSAGTCAAPRTARSWSSCGHATRSSRVSAKALRAPRSAEDDAVAVYFEGPRRTSDTHERKRCFLRIHQVMNVSSWRAACLQALTKPEY
ncbi:hypothetical protein PC115_g4211 [Phytophthora cactorum]|uniref:Uncharacterized protein n=1 Tax=Phytophthora cactorum TaxID=29920 RepID=A0A8T1D9W6_9STRA|nr:hypothetical protein PC115_g4211 [Phytophthora cactorum]